MEMMAGMGYDAMAIGNHEFDYGAENFERQMYRVSFPVLGANIFFRGTSHRYSRPHTILERNGVRLGVIGIIGQDARSVALPSGIANLSRPAGRRLLDLRIGGRPVEDARVYRVATNSFLAQGGDLYETFLRARKVGDSGVLLSDVVIEFLREHRRVGLTEPGRLVPAREPR